MDPAAFSKSTVIIKWRYVTPTHAARAIRSMHRTCAAGPYLDCVLEYAETTRMTQQFADLHRMPELADPEAFLCKFDEMDLVLAEDAPETP
jgi:hypothetical protein